MISENIIKNINKIDFDLKELFENVQISEISKGNQFFFEISANSKFSNINESINNKRVETKVLINKNDLQSNNIRWKYSPNPFDKSCELIERVSSIDNISNEIFETITKCKMHKEYFNNLDILVDSINESNVTIDRKESISESITSLLSDFNIKVNSIDVENSKEMFSTDKTINILHESVVIKPSDSFILNNKLSSIPGVNSIQFGDNIIKIDYSI